jgi:hypothetical protein
MEEKSKVLKREQARSQKDSITDPIMIRDKSSTTHLEVLLQFSGSRYWTTWTTVRIE